MHSQGTVIRVCVGEGAGRDSKDETPAMNPRPQDIPKDGGRQAGQRGLHSEMTLKGWQLPNSVWGGSLSEGPWEPFWGLRSPVGVPSQPEWQRWGPGQPEPSTCNDHPDKHFLPCQLMGLASSGSCQAPAAGEKSPIIPAIVERRASSDSRRACGSKHIPPSRMWADGRAVCPVSRPAPCPASVIRALGSGCWHFSCNQPGGAELASSVCP